MHRIIIFFFFFYKYFSQLFIWLKRCSLSYFFIFFSLRYRGLLWRDVQFERYRYWQTKELRIEMGVGPTLQPKAFKSCSTPRYFCSVSRLHTCVTETYVWLNNPPPTPMPVGPPWPMTCHACCSTRERGPALFFLLK